MVQRLLKRKGEVFWIPLSPTGLGRKSPLLVGRRKSSVQKNCPETAPLLALVSTTLCVAQTEKCSATLAFCGRQLAPVDRRSQCSMRTPPADGQTSPSTAEYATVPRCPVPNPVRTLECPCVPPIEKPTTMPVWLSWRHVITTPACMLHMKGIAGQTSSARTGSPGWEGSKFATGSRTARVVGKTRRRIAWGSCRPSAGTPAPRCSCTIRHRLPSYLPLSSGTCSCLRGRWLHLPQSLPARADGVPTREEHHSSVCRPMSPTIQLLFMGGRSSSL